MISIIGAGLAGSETAYQISKAGIQVNLYEMKPKTYTQAHTNPNYAEIVCSNSFKSNLITNACGLLKEELRTLGSLLIKCADETSVPAGQALAVDREKYADLVTKKLKEQKNIEIKTAEIRKRHSLKRNNRPKRVYRNSNRTTNYRQLKQRNRRTHRRRQTTLLRRSSPNNRKRHNRHANRFPRR